MGAGEDSKSKRHKKSSSSKKKHKHKSEHKHKSSSSKKHHHKHGKSHKKHSKHKEKKRSDEVNLQTALENLEMLEDILKTSTEYSPEELMEQVLNEARAGGGLAGDSEDSSGDSDASLDLGDKPRSPAATLKDTKAVLEKAKEPQLGSSDGKGSSSDSVPKEVKTELTVPQEAEKEPAPPVAKQEATDDHKNEVARTNSSADSKDTTPPSRECEDKSRKVEKKQPNSQTVHTKTSLDSKSDLDSTSDSEAESKQKAAKGTSNGTSVFKSFSKKVKALGSKTEIKINIRQKETDKTVQEKEEKSDADSSKKESRERKRDSESRRHKRSSRRSRTRSRSHSRSHSRYRRRHSRSHSRSPRQRRSRSRSRSYTRRSRRGRSHSRSRRRSRSRSYSHSRRRSRSRSHSRSRRRSRNRSRSYSSTPPPSKRKKSSANKQKPKDNSTKPKSEEKSNQITVVETKIDKKTEISQLTAFCKDLQEKQAHEDVYGETPQAEETAQIHHPFAVNPNQQTSSFHQPSLIFHNNAWKTTNQLAIEAAVSEAAKPLVEKFPVSAGLQHTREETEDGSGTSNVFAQYQELSKMSVSDLVAKRMEVQKQILINPADTEAHQALNYIQKQTSMWAESQVTPGQYTGQQKITPLSKEAHNTGYQAWAKKRMFHGLAPVGDGFGMKMLKKMGWREGQPIGKQGEGHVEPICLDVKMDRSGLTTESDYSKVGGGVQPAAVLRATKADMKTASLVQGKHPVSALQELCARKRWDPPCYTLKEDAGPAHLKMFIYQVTIPLGTFQPAVGSNSKKLAKMQAATAALQGLGLLEKTIEYTTL